MSDWLHFRYWTLSFCLFMFMRWNRFTWACQMKILHLNDQKQGWNLQACGHSINKNASEILGIRAMPLNEFLLSIFITQLSNITQTRLPCQISAWLHTDDIQQFNKEEVILSDLHFKDYIVCLCSKSATIIVPNKAVLHIWAAHSGVVFLNKSAFLN